MPPDAMRLIFLLDKRFLYIFKLGPLSVPSTEISVANIFFIHLLLFM